MAHVITEPCIDIKDRSCVEACPVDCIHDAGEHLVIDPASCVDCGACIPACPVSAIYETLDVPTEWEPFIDRAVAWQEGARPATNRRLDSPQ